MSRFRIDPSSGALQAEERGPTALAGKSGTYALQPSGPDLLVLARTPPGGGGGTGPLPTPRVVLAGDAGGFPLPDLIAFLSQSRWTGIIRCQAPGGERTVTLREGEVRAATSEDPSERLGEVLVRLGYVDRPTLERILREHPPSKIGRALVDRGVLQAHDLFKCITQQISDIFHSIVLAREGAFFLTDAPAEDKAGHNIQLSTQSLLMDSIRKIDELAHFRKRIPHGRLYPVRKRPSDGKLEEEEELVLKLADGRKNLLELAHAARLSEFDVTKVAFRLLEGGFVALADAPAAAAGAPISAPPIPAHTPRPGRPPPPPAGEHRQVARIFNFIFREIRDEVAKQGMAREFIAAANAALLGQALSASPVLAGLAFAEDGSLPEDRLVESFERYQSQLGAEPVASFRQALKDVMFFLLFQAGELLESRADEDLARRVKELLATLGGP